jgi:hypothetical protein
MLAIVAAVLFLIALVLDAGQSSVRTSSNAGG